MDPPPCLLTFRLSVRPLELIKTPPPRRFPIIWNWTVKIIREEWVTIQENKKEDEAVDLETEHGTRCKSQQKQGAINKTEPLLPIPCRIKKLIELKEDEPTVATSVTEEYHRQDVKQKQPLKIHPLRHRKADEKTIDCKQATSNIIPIQIRRSDYQQDIRKSRIPKPTWQKKLRNLVPENYQLPPPLSALPIFHIRVSCIFLI